MGYYDKFRKLTEEEEVERDQMIFGMYDPEEYKRGGIRSFSRVDPKTVAALVEKGYANPDEAQNNSPCIQEFLDFCEQHPKTDYTLSGYTVSRERADCRVSVDQIIGILDMSKEGVTLNDAIEEILAFYERFRYADEIEVTQDGDSITFYAWYD